MSPLPKVRPMSDADVRIPPHSIEAEQAVLGGLMLDPHGLERIADRLFEQDFYRRDHRLIYRAIRGLADSGKPFDAVTLGDWFVSSGQMISPELQGYIIELANITPSAANIMAYAGIVRDRSVKRQLLQAGTSIADEALDPAGPDSHALLENAEQRVFRIATTSAQGQKDVVPVAHAVKDAFAVLSKRYMNQGQLTGVSTGFPELDRLLAGLQPADLIVVAARPSIGKTAFALNIAEAAAIGAKKATLVFSMEMSHSQLAMRLISSIGRVNQQHLRTGEIAEEEWPRITNAIAMLTANSHLFIDDTPALAPSELRSRARRIHREQEHGLGLIVVDYLQLMQVTGTKENRATEVAEISRSLKALAKELDVPVIALSQLNRSLEQRADKRPVMADLRESGSIEQDADVIMFIYRDEYYNKDSPDKGKAEIIIGKQRNGPTDTVKLNFLGQYTRFESVADASFPMD
ncbi:replicative DNA helicase [Rhodanobacter sp. B2A1Ga4]|uniref:replicative DNA helicase n=1 Tax=Rhodanobacter sp. B2A1Ga4 TaxID=2778647 RepID=UPI001B36FE17|nr:replicative DNA helicase [Rhodanobacter sp. B2A1Ga4]MBQ4855768.1 replicative DNA helicase [Rhodanobacter sp. B2A1Ga4]